MAAGAKIAGWSGVSRRRGPRFLVQAPLDVTVLRSGIPDTVPGRLVNLGERGIAAMMSAELLPGETVGVEVRLPLLSDGLRARAMVRYQDRLRCGLEFVGWSAEQQAAIRDWAKEAKAEVEVSVSPKPAMAKKGASEGSSEASGSTAAVGPRRKQGWLAWGIAPAVMVVAAGLFWWHWNRQWGELEAGLRTREAATVEKPQAQVPAEVMEKLIVHRVEPTYPVEARRANLQGIIALDIVVGRDGTVVSMRPLNGPDVLTRAAMDALRWWRFEPYRLNGEPAVVETRVAVEFKR